MTEPPSPLRMLLYRHTKRREFIMLLGGAALLAFSTFMCGNVAANAAPLRIVAIGASNTHGWYVGNQGAYPAQLQALLRAKGRASFIG